MAKKFKQPQPETITPEEVVSFDMRQEFQVLKDNCPLLFHCVTGAMELGRDQAKV